jgi:hypothetical protein
MAVANVDSSLLVQTQDGSFTKSVDQRLWLNGIQFGDHVPVSLFQDSSFLTEVDDSNPIEAHNVKRVDATHAVVDIYPAYGSAIYGADVYGAPDTHSPTTIVLPIETERCQLHVQITSDLPIAIQVARFYAYDGIIDTNPYRGIQFYAAEGGVSSQWFAANGSTQALSCATHPLALQHDYYLALSATPTDTGEKQGKIKFVYTYAQA